MSWAVYGPTDWEHRAALDEIRAVEVLREIRPTLLGVDRIREILENTQRRMMRDGYTVERLGRMIRGNR